MSAQLTTASGLSGSIRASPSTSRAPLLTLTVVAVRLSWLEVPRLASDPSVIELSAATVAPASAASVSVELIVTLPSYSPVWMLTV